MTRKRKQSASATPAAGDDLAEGIARYYASQADIMLAQFRNINDLLGTTHHHTWPGTLCEVLLRSCLRKFIPPGWSADKGFFHGRAPRGMELTHGPEIDILIHHTDLINPLFRMEDFVIVHPDSVRAMIQVKTSFSGKELAAGIANVIEGKRCLHRITHGRNESSVSAVIGFDGKISAARLAKCLVAKTRELLDLSKQTDVPVDTVWRFLPDIIGTASEDGGFAIRDPSTVNKALYSGYKNTRNSAATFLQAMLRCIWNRDLHMVRLPLTFPVRGESPEWYLQVSVSPETGRPVSEIKAVTG